MQEHPDDEAAREGLDRLFRKSAEEFNPQYDPAAWQLLNARLDEHDRVTAWGRVLRWGLAVMALVVILSGGWYGFRQLGSKPARIGIENAQPVRQKETLPIASQLPNPKNVASKRVALQPNQDIAGRHIDDQPMQIEASQRRRLNWPVVRQQSLSGEEKLAVNAPGRNTELPGSRKQIGSGRPTGTTQLSSLRAESKRKNRTDPPTPDQVAPNRTTTDRTTDNRLTNRTVLNKANVVRDGLNNFDATRSDVTRSGSEQTKPGVGELNSFEPSTKSYTTNALLGDATTVGNDENFRIGPVDALDSRGAIRWPEWSPLAIPAFAQTASEPAGGKSSTIHERGLSVRAVISPDLSAVGMKNFVQPGTNYGFLIEYRFNKRFSAQAGVIQSKKIYKATPEQYAWPANWKWYVKPISVEAICDMLDIPINLRYDFAVRPLGDSRPSARWFVSGGVTTYIMQKEQYNYVYENPQNPWIRNRSTSAKTGRYNFSNLNLSVGYERPIGRRFAWQIEPFVKMPLKEVGYFKIHLLSTGAFLSVRYRL